MKILITGANGQLGRALNRLLDERDRQEADNKGTAAGLCCERVNTDVWDRKEGYPAHFVRKDLRFLDITDRDMVDAMIAKEKPEVVINCAAFTAVDRCETEQEAAYRLNAVGPENLARAVREQGGVLVQISTDYVFAGDAKTPYAEDAQADPQSVYGATKWEGEQKVRELLDRHFIIRTAWLYGDGNNFVRTMLRLSKTVEELKVVNDQMGSPTYAGELAEMILNLITTDAYGTYHGTCTGETSWYAFAVKIFELAGLSQRVIPVSTKEYGSSTRRPAYSVLENKKYPQLGFQPLKNWEAALADYICSKEVQEQ